MAIDRSSPQPESIDITLPEPQGDVPSWREYGVILYPRVYRPFFRGYKLQMTFEADVGEVETWVTSAPRDTRVGDPEAGNYICSPRPAERTPGRLSVKEWYEEHPELEPGDVLRITRLAESLYRLEIVDSD